MFRNNQEFSEKYFPFLDRFFGFSKRLKLLTVDFNLPWWKIIWDQRKLAAVFLFAEFLFQIFVANVSLSIGWVINSGEYQYLNLIFLVWVGLVILLIFNNYINTLLQVQTINSVHYAATKYFLTVDPIFHSTRSSGQIITKVNRGSESFESVMDLASFDIFRVIIRSSSVTLSLFLINRILGWIALINLSLIFILAIISKLASVSATSPRYIADEDVYKSTALETIREIYLIRSIFASNEQNNRLKNNYLSYMNSTAVSWQTNTTIDLFIRIIYVFSLGFLVNTCVWLTQSNQISQVIALAVISTYFVGTNEILQIGKSFERIIDRITRIRDLYTFIRSFGKQNYPVLEGDIKNELVSDTRTNSGHKTDVSLAPQ